MTYFLLFLMGFFAAAVGTITAGGSSLLLLAGTSVFLPQSVAIIVVGFSNMLSAAYRAFLYRRDGHRAILRFLIPSTIIGTLIGALLFGVLATERNITVLKFLMGLLLCGAGTGGLLRLRVMIFKPKMTHVFSMGLITGFLSGLVGAGTPIINALLQKFNLTTTVFAGTRAIHLLVQHMVKSAIYLFLLLVAGKSIIPADIAFRDYFLYAVISAAGGMIGVYVGKHTLDRMNARLFNILLNVMMLLYGVYLLAAFI